MSKELTPLEAWKLIDKSGTIETLCIIETALKNYEEGLNNAKTYVKHTSSHALYDLLGLAIKNVDRSFWKLPEQLFDDVNKSLKALEIIKEKGVDTFRLKVSINVVDYNTDEYVMFYCKELTQEEFDLLKEVML